MKNNPNAQGAFDADAKLKEAMQRDGIVNIGNRVVVDQAGEYRPHSSGVVYGTEGFHRPVSQAVASKAMEAAEVVVRTEG